MNRANRIAQSERMKAYWASRRAQTAAHPPLAIRSEPLPPLPNMVDIASSDYVEVIVAGPPGDYCVWVNIEDVCRLRCYRIKDIQFYGDAALIPHNPQSESSHKAQT